MTFSIAPIGSCRIVDPLRRARERYGFDMNRNRSLGFCHSSPEAVQQVKLMRGEIDIAENLWDVVSNIDREEVLSQRGKPSDLYVVELSSEKILTHGDTCLQLNYLRTQYPEFFSDNDRKNGYWRAIEKGTAETVVAFLEKEWSDTPAKAAQSDFLKDIRLRRADEEQTRSDIRYLRDTLPHVLFVTHVNALEKTGKPIKTRDRYVQMVKKIAAEEGCPVYDPTDLVTALGQDDMLEEDLNHYTDTFKDRVVDDWFDKHLTDTIATIVRENHGENVELMLSAHVTARLNHSDESEANKVRAWLAGLVSEFPALKPVASTLEAAE